MSPEAKLARSSRIGWLLLAVIVGLAVTLGLSMAFTGEAQATKHKHKGTTRTGPPGPPGPPGTALAFAHINADGTLNASRSKNTRASTKPSGSTGLYCIDFTVTPRNVIATPETTSATGLGATKGGTITQHTAGSGLGGAECGAGTTDTYNVQVLTRDLDGTRQDMAFDIAVN